MSVLSSSRPLLLPPPPRRLSAQGWTLLSIALAAVISVGVLGLDPRALWPGESGRALVVEFFSHALSPALAYEAASVPAGTPPLLLKALSAAWVTVVFAATAMSLSIGGGFILGFLASTAWWSQKPNGGETRWERFRDGSLGPAVFAVTRLFIAVTRSVHELLWAVLFLAAFGLGDTTAVLAIAIPFAGTLAKVFSEMIDEAPREAAAAIQDLGASSFQAFCFGLLPRALPDMAAYSFYRFECALRSSAIMGFFGFPTLGYHISASFENLHYGEVWTFLYTLIALVIIVDLWSGRLRRSLTR